MKIKHVPLIPAIGMVMINASVMATQSIRINGTEKLKGDNRVYNQSQAQGRRRQSPFHTIYPHEPVNLRPGQPQIQYYPQHATTFFPEDLSIISQQETVGLDSHQKQPPFLSAEEALQVIGAVSPDVMTNKKYLAVEYLEKIKPVSKYRVEIQQQLQKLLDYNHTEQVAQLLEYHHLGRMVYGLDLTVSGIGAHNEHDWWRICTATPSQGSKMREVCRSVLQAKSTKGSSQETLQKISHLHQQKIAMLKKMSQPTGRQSLGTNDRKTPSTTAGSGMSIVEPKGQLVVDASKVRFSTIESAISEIGRPTTSIHTRLDALNFIRCSWDQWKLEIQAQIQRLISHHLVSDAATLLTHRRIVSGKFQTLADVIAPVNLKLHTDDGPMGDLEAWKRICSISRVKGPQLEIICQRLCRIYLF